MEEEKTEIESITVDITRRPNRTHTVFNILTNLGLHDYVAVFDHKGYDDVQDLHDMNEEDWTTFINDTGLKPRHAVRLQRQLQTLSSEQDKIEDIIAEKANAFVKGWTEKQVWQWISSRPYGEKLSMPAWEFTDGATLLELTPETAKELQVPTILIPQLLKDIKSISQESGSFVVSEEETHVSKKGPSSIVAENQKKIEVLENALDAMDYRQHVQGMGDEFQGSLIWVALIMAITYVVLSSYMWLINADRPYTSAIIPTMGFQLSTLPLPSIRACYVGHKLRDRLVLW